MPVAVFASPVVGLIWVDPSPDLRQRQGEIGQNPFFFPPSETSDRQDRDFSFRTLTPRTDGTCSAARKKEAQSQSPPRPIDGNRVGSTQLPAGGDAGPEPTGHPSPYSRLLREGDIRYERPDPLAPRPVAGRPRPVAGDVPRSVRAGSPRRRGPLVVLPAK